MNLGDKNRTGVKTKLSLRSTPLNAESKRGPAATKSEGHARGEKTRLAKTWTSGSKIRRARSGQENETGKMKSLGHTVEPSGKEIFFSVLDGNQVLDRTWPQEDLGRPEPARMAPWREKEIKRQLSNTQRGEENLEERTGAGR
jgi:hypothetical protein